MKSISFLEQNNVDVKKCIETFGSVEKYSVSLSSFVIDIHNKINELIKFLNNGDLANYVVYASSLKSDASYYGFTKLEQIAYDHEIQSNV